MKIKSLCILLVAFAIVALFGIFSTPSATQARTSQVRVQPNLSIEPYKSDAVRISESYQNFLSNYVNSMEKRVTIIPPEFEKVHTKLDSIEKKIDDISTRLSAIEKALNITQEIPRPE